MQDRSEIIINQFAESWVKTEQFFDDLINTYHSYQHLKPILQFIKGSKEQGEHHHFRLGTSLYRLIISRSVNYGLRRDQKYIIMDAHHSDIEVKLCDGEKVYREYLMETLDDERLTNLLKTLKDTLID